LAKTEALVTIVTEERPLTQVENIHYKVVDWIRGRFRMRLPRLASDSEYASILKYLVQSLDFVTSVRINPAASSLVVEYNREASAEAIATLQSQVFTAIQQADFAVVRHWPSVGMASMIQRLLPMLMCRSRLLEQRILPGKPPMWC